MGEIVNLAERYSHIAMHERSLEEAEKEAEIEDAFEALMQSRPHETLSPAVDQGVEHAIGKVVFLEELKNRKIVSLNEWRNKRTNQPAG